jgi:hypothetical protein
MKQRRRDDGRGAAWDRSDFSAQICSYPRFEQRPRLLFDESQQSADMSCSCDVAADSGGGGSERYTGVLVKIRKREKLKACQTLQRRKKLAMVIVHGRQGKT